MSGRMKGSSISSNDLCTLTNILLSALSVRFTTTDSYTKSCYPYSANKYFNFYHFILTFLFLRFVLADLLNLNIPGTLRFYTAVCFPSLSYLRYRRSYDIYVSSHILYLIYYTISRIFIYYSILNI